MGNGGPKNWGSLEFPVIGWLVWWWIHWQPARAQVGQWQFSRSTLTSGDRWRRWGWSWLESAKVHWDLDSFCEVLVLWGMFLVLSFFKIWEVILHISISLFFSSHDKTCYKRKTPCWFQGRFSQKKKRISDGSLFEGPRRSQKKPCIRSYPTDSFTWFWLMVDLSPELKKSNQVEWPIMVSSSCQSRHPFSSERKVHHERLAFIWVETWGDAMKYLENLPSDYTFDVTRCRGKI